MPWNQQGRADSYAFLEVFFDNAGSSNPTSQAQRGVKREREEDDNVGLSLDGDDSSPSATNPIHSVGGNVKVESAPVAAPLPLDGQDKEGLKRAYDDALAARGLISVSRSSEKLTDLALPAKMQRTISQEYLKNMNSGGAPPPFTSFSFNPGPAQPSLTNIPNSSTTNNDKLTFPHPEPGQQNQSQQTQIPSTEQTIVKNRAALNNSSKPSVEVPATTKCAICGKTNVDTQLRPCGCMFHGRCLKPSLQNAVGTPRCPIDNVLMQSAVLAIPTDENSNNATCTVAMNSFSSTTSTTATNALQSTQEISNISTT